MNLPNSLTILRIFFVPLLVVVLLTREPNFEIWGFSMHFEIWGVLILLAAASTDWADGYLARKRSEVTTLGILSECDCSPDQASDADRSHRRQSLAAFATCSAASPCDVPLPPTISQSTTVRLAVLVFTFRALARADSNSAPVPISPEVARHDPNCNAR